MTYPQTSQKADFDLVRAALSLPINGAGAAPDYFIEHILNARTGLAIIICKTSGAVRLCSTVAANLLHSSGTELIGRNVAEFFGDPPNLSQLRNGDVFEDRISLNDVLSAPLFGQVRPVFTQEKVVGYSLTLLEY